MAFRDRASAHAALDEMYRRMGAADRCEVFISLLEHGAAAKALDRSFAAAPDGALTGMILAVKDNIDVEGFATTAACPGFPRTGRPDAAAVAALRREGATIIGKTNLDQFATGLVGTRSPYGAVRDSRRPDRISGGSSSGSAVSVAMGFVDASLGTDTAGSGRVPAGLQGIIGVKATVGAVSNEGVVPACASYDCVTVFAESAAIAGKIMGIMSRTGSRDWPADLKCAAPDRPIVGIPAELPGLSESWAAGFARAVAALRANGADVRKIDLAPSIAAAKMLYESPIVSERAEAVGEFVGAAPATGTVQEGTGYEADAIAGLDPTVAGIVRAAGRFSATDVLAARRELDRRRRTAMAEWEGVDVVMVPTAPFHPTIAEVQADPIDVNARMGTYTNFCNLFDLCAVSVPAGEVAEDDGSSAQFGVTLLGRAFRDGVVADVAALVGGPVDGDEHGGSANWVIGRAPEMGVLPLVVFGAHLRGQPLNSELTGLGAAFVGDVSTAPTYRLLALATQPPKPGLTRVGGEGVAGSRIAGEEWIMSPAALGTFLAHLPEPMALGAVELSDGRWVTGFTCQPDAVIGAPDISRFGGWRNYLQSK
ncbi:allophanate hydrolase [Corynebacterium xerosis]|uniref:allophanate hydrolase n=1 Tax=Corynebacterium xerosis TaxID=1725 RepID=UPI003655A84B